VLGVLLPAGLASGELTDELLHDRIGLVSRAQEDEQPVRPGFTRRVMVVGLASFSRSLRYVQAARLPSMLVRAQEAA
jgi:hypothetical protein